MSWQVSELDKNKTEQCIINEKVRLDYCRKERERLVQERNKFKEETDIKLKNYYDKIETLNRSIKYGDEFIEECQEHLKDFENGEIN